jgi:hypothetical protein
LLIDLHIHTSKYSWCSSIEPQQAVYKALELGLDGIALVEHDRVWSDEDIIQLKTQTKANSLIILRGQEISCNTEDKYRHGHLITFGYYRIDHQNLSTREVIAAVHREGGLAIAAHPFRGGFGLGEDIYLLDIDGIEVLHPQHDAKKILKARQACSQLNLPALAGSDAHEVIEIGTYITYFPHDIHSEEDLIREIKAQRCQPGSLSDFKSG